MTGYAFPNATAQAADRLHALEAAFDPTTIRHLAATGVGPGWRCLEVGGGAGSIAAWLARRVGPAGFVLATDVDPRLLQDRPELAGGLANGHVEVRRHDIATEPLPEAAFDLIHARLVLHHLPAREAALARLVAALRPGGWLVVSDFDGLADRLALIADPAAAVRYGRMLHALGQLLGRSGTSGDWGRTLARRFRDHGLIDVELDGHLALWTGGSAGARFDRASFEQVRAELIATGSIDDGTLDRVLALLDDPAFAVGSPLLLTARGRSPSQPSRPLV